MQEAIKKKSNSFLKIWTLTCLCFPLVASQILTITGRKKLNVTKQHSFLLFLSEDMFEQCLVQEVHFFFFCLLPFSTGRCLRRSRRCLSWCRPWWGWRGIWKWHWHPDCQQQWVETHSLPPSHSPIHTHTQAICSFDFLRKQRNKSILSTTEQDISSFFLIWVLRLVLKTSQYCHSDT